MWRLAPFFLEASASRHPDSSLGARSGSNPVLYDSRGNPFQPQHPNQSSGASISGSSPAGLQSSPLTQCIWTFFWLGVLCCIAFPVALAACELYILLSPISAFCEKFNRVTDFLFKVSQFPSLCARNMIEARPAINLC
ncbi:uncharacterized protein LOC128396763 [Panonychus citri]|uniref:uncharacterized protein LOC128396763 n=1 Tax=Panonychus citri TaxID=50023 RepID=UPI002307E118|nr:uncharacterized protein LOC128396763 [Panonychus citri]